MKGKKGLFFAVLAAAVCVLMAAPGAWAQDGEYLIFPYNAGGGFDSIQWMVPDATDTQQPLVTMPGADLNCPRVSKDNVNMAFIDLTTGLIWVFEIGVSGPVPLSNPVPAKSLAWSSDGTQIYYWGSDYIFYTVPAAGGATTPLFGGQSFWAWFNDGGFEVYGEPQADGSFTDHILVGAADAPFGKCNLLQLQVQAEAVAPVALFAGLGDNYTPSRGPVDGKMVFQADHDMAGSHRIYTYNPADGSSLALTDLYSGSPAWNPSQTLFVFPLTTASTYGSAAYQGIIFARHEVDGAVVPQFTTGVGRTPSFYGDLAPAE